MQSVSTWPLLQNNGYHTCLANSAGEKTWAKYLPADARNCTGPIMPPHLSLWPCADQLHRKWGHKVVKYDGNYHLQKPLIWARPILGALHSSPHLILTVTYEVGLMLQMNILRQREARQLCRFTQPVSTRTKNWIQAIWPQSLCT